MASKTANVLARVEPDVKEQAESILAQLGVPASTVINMLYKQIILTKSIPFSISIPSHPIARDELSTDTFNAMMQEGLSQAKTDKSRPASEVFEEIRQSI